jgi:hypothetical protein
MIIYSPTFTGSVQITGSQTVTGDLTVQGNLTAQTFILSSSVSYFTESFASGSTRFGDSMDDTMKVTGSLLLTGSMFINTVTAQNAASNRGNLTINGATSILNLATGDTNAGYLYHGGTDLLLVNAKNGAMQFYTNDTERMRITSGSQVGIGTTFVDPTVSVDIQNASPLSNNVFLRLKNNNASEDCGIIISGSFGGAVEYRMGINTIVSSKDFTFSNSNTAGYRWYVDGSERMRISGSGDVGIGNTGYTSTRLTVTGKSDTSSDFSFVANNSSNSNLFLVRNDGNVGIGANPSYTLDVNGNAAATRFYVASGGNATDPMIRLKDDTDTGFFFPAGNTIAFSTGATERMRINSSGQVLLGTTTSSQGQVLEVNGGIYMTSTIIILGTNIQYGRHGTSDGVQFTAGPGGVYLDYGNTSWTSLSDERFKNIDSEISNATESLMTLRTVKYSLKDDERNKINLGLIAQDVVKVFPEIVDIENDEIGKMGVRYTELIPILVASIQELKAEIDELKNK